MEFSQWFGRRLHHRPRVEGSIELLAVGGGRRLQHFQSTTAASTTTTTDGHRTLDDLAAAMHGRLLLH